MTRFTMLLAAAAALVTLPVLAETATGHGAVQIENPYARTMGGIGTSGAVFFEIVNHGDADDRLVDARSDVAQKVELHTHKDDGNGVMQMMHVPEGFAVPAMGGHALQRGGDHVMLMGLTRELKDGDMVSVTLVFEKAGEMVIEAPVDNARKDGGHGHGHGQMQHGQGETAPSN